MKAEMSENAGVHRRLRVFIPALQDELRCDASSGLEGQDRGIQSECRLACITDSGRSKIRGPSRHLYTSSLPVGILAHERHPLTHGHDAHAFCPSSTRLQIRTPV